jgi:hypothetical protein
MRVANQEWSSPLSLFLSPLFLFLSSLPDSECFLKSRFGHLFENDDYILAAISHPKFKLSWLSPESRSMASNKLEGALGIQSNDETSLNSHTSGEDILEDVEESIAKTKWSDLFRILGKNCLCYNHTQTFKKFSAS